MTPDATPSQVPTGQLPHEQSKGWTLLLVWASWSPWSRRLKQDLEAAARPPGLKLLSLQVEDAGPSVTALAIPSVPYLILLHEGKEVTRHPGDGLPPELLEWAQAKRSGASTFRRS